MCIVEFRSMEHFESIHAQMEHEEEGRITLKFIPNLTNMTFYHSMVTMSKQFHDLETYLSQHYGLEGIPHYKVWQMLAATSWTSFA